MFRPEMYNWCIEELAGRLQAAAAVALLWELFCSSGDKQLSFLPRQNSIIEQLLPERSFLFDS